LNVESEEIEIAINELEVRLERLRALYEQYFLGFEKIEPAVARKDVDRRIYVLRREKIRNTARRFRLQNIIQRYNTFQQYWQRICREIENGTYKRHLLRAERTVGPTDLMTAAARRRFGKERERSSAPPATADEAKPTPAPVPAAPQAPRAPGAPPPPPRRPPPLPPGATTKPEAPSANASVPAGRAPPLTRAPGGPPPPPTRAAPPPPRPAAQAAKPQAPSEQGAARPVRPAPAERPAATAASADPKARELHERLVAASKAAKRPAVSLDTLEKTMKSTEASLRAKHPNRRIEFDIVLKDGKPVLKPIVR
jgi:hypothetical protein